MTITTKQAESLKTWPAKLYFDVRNDYDVDHELFQHTTEPFIESVEYIKASTVRDRELALEAKLKFASDQYGKMLNLAKDYKDERDAAYKREQEIVRLACLAAADQAREHQKEIEAIRTRGTK